MFQIILNGNSGTGTIGVTVLLLMQRIYCAKKRQVFDSLETKGTPTMTIQATMSLHQCLKQAQVPLAHHESDLYFPVTPGSTAILSQFPLQQKNATTFIDNVTGSRWYDVPFSYEVSPEE